MSIILIPPKKRIENKETLNVAELFYNTIQGEGIYTGVPAVFLRLSGCPLNCSFCDTTSIWKGGQPLSIEEILAYFKRGQTMNTGALIALMEKAHLIITGGSPLMQQDNLILFLKKFNKKFGFIPFIEIENEAIYTIDKYLENVISCWNNSPKLSNSRVTKDIRIQPKVLQQLSSFSNSWFKFVISNTKKDWQEIENDYLPFIKRKQIILMPEGVNKETIEKKQQDVVNLAIKQNVRYSTRLHIDLWNKTQSI